MKPRFLVTDLRHFLEGEVPHDELPLAWRRLHDQLVRIVQAAAMRPADLASVTEVPCRRRPQRRRCPGPIRVRRTDVPDEVRWHCAGCDEEGVITHWRATPREFSRVAQSTPAKSRGTRARSIHQLEIELLHVEPRVWRRVEVPSVVTLGRLHAVIQAAMGWTDSHLHMFAIDGVRYGTPDLDDELPMCDERRVRLCDVAPSAPAELTYTYDFGDGWRHRVRVDAVLPADASARSARCLAGERACPPEDVGGPPGYMSFLEAVLDPHHPEHREYVTWAGGPFDPERCDLRAINAALGGRLRG